jgi:hypothetical protein
MTGVSADIRVVFAALAVIIFLLSNYQIHILAGTQEQPHGTMPMEQITQTSGKMNEVLHDNRMMIEVNSYKITNSINNSLIHDSTENKFLLVDLSVRSISHTLKLSPNVFVLKTDVGRIAPSSLTSHVDGGLRPIYLGDGQAIRTFLLFESPSLGDVTLTLEYSDGSSFFSIALVPIKSPQSPMLGVVEPRYRTGDIMQGDSLKVLANVSTADKRDKFESRPDINALNISLLFENIGNSTVRIDPSYVFILDNQSFAYSVSEADSNLLSSPLRTVELNPEAITRGNLIVQVPKNSTNLIFMYGDPNNSFLALLY